MTAAVAVGLDGTFILYATIWLVTLGTAVVGAFLIVRGRPIAGIGALLAAAAAWLPFFWHAQGTGIVWTVGVVAGVVLIAWGTRADTDRPIAAPLLLARFAVGWAFLDNAVNDQVFLPAGGGFLATATAAAGRAPLDFIDPVYHGFVKATILPHGPTWAGLFLGGEFAFGLLLAIGLFTPVAAWGAIWLSANIILEKSFITHGTFTDKTYLMLEVVNLVAGSGRAHGLDAALRKLVPPPAVEALTGADLAPGSPMATTTPLGSPLPSPN